MALRGRSLIKMNVPQVRDRIKSVAPDAKLFLLLDNMLVVKEIDHMIKWDDENELVYVGLINENHRDIKHPIAYRIVPYEYIQYIEVDCGNSDFLALGKEFGFDEDTLTAKYKDLTTIKL
jgi:hypothetical protein